MCVCGGGGGSGGLFVVVVVVVVVFNGFFFFEFRAKQQIVFLPNKQNLEEYFRRQHFQCKYFHIAY